MTEKTLDEVIADIRANAAHKMYGWTHEPSRYASHYDGRKTLDVIRVINKEWDKYCDGEDGFEGGVWYKSAFIGIHEVRVCEADILVIAPVLAQIRTGEFHDVTSKAISYEERKTGWFRKERVPVERLITEKQPKLKLAKLCDLIKVDSDEYPYALTLHTRAKEARRDVGGDVLIYSALTSESNAKAIMGYIRSNLGIIDRLFAPGLFPDWEKIVHRNPYDRVILLFPEDCAKLKAVKQHASFDLEKFLLERAVPYSTQ